MEFFKPVSFISTEVLLRGYKRYEPSVWNVNRLSKFFSYFELSLTLSGLTHVMSDGHYEPEIGMFTDLPSFLT